MAASAAAAPENTARLLECDIRSSQPTVLRDEVAARTTPHEVTHRTGSLNGRVGAVCLPSSRIVFVRYGGEVDVETSPTRERLVATVPLGPMRAREGRSVSERVFDSGFVLSRRDSTVMRPDPWNGALVVTGEPDRLTQHAELVLDEAEQETSGEIVGLHDSPLLERACRNAWSIATNLPDSTPPDVMAGVITVLEDQLLTALVLASRPRTTSLPINSRIGDLVEWLRENYMNPITLSDMASISGVSIRRMQHAVRVETGLTPTEVLRDIRMQAAHRALVRADPQTTTVARIAHSCGITHLGRFSQQYRAKYGHSPSQTLNGLA